MNSTAEDTAALAHGDAGDRRKRKTSASSEPRSLVSDMLKMQLAFALIISILSLGGFWWVSERLVSQNLDRWAEQWVMALDELAMPLYAGTERENFVAIEDYVRRFEEIAYVRFYSGDGVIIFTDNPRPGAPLPAALPVADLERLAETALDTPEYFSERDTRNASGMRLGKAVWIESFAGDGLFGLDAGGELPVQRELAGFIEMGLDFQIYRAQVTRNIFIGAMLTAIVLILLVSLSWAMLRKALKPLHALHRPLMRIARGHTNFSVMATGHREIRAIAGAINTTVQSLQERDDELWYLANHDELTGLFNRHRFMELLGEELENIAEDRHTSALLFIDLDQFKCINDTLGHAAGDRFLADAADRISGLVRKQDLVARFGGDEFAILLRDLPRREARAIANEIVRHMWTHRYIEDDKAFSVPCSIGVAVIRSDKYGPEELMAQADMACHEAKSRGRNRVEIYTHSSETQHITSDFAWSQRIRTALAEDQFTLLYQPITHIETGEVSHYEVLLRMRDGNKMISPNVFIPAANRFGLMPEIDVWVIENALRALSLFRRNNPDLAFTLNISGALFHDRGVLNPIRDSLRANKVPADALIIEITEQVAIRNMTSAEKQIDQLRELGCRFAIDDFGTGYSSFSYLKKLPVEYIKVDGSFIRNLTSDPQDQAIVEAINNVAQASGKQTIAEYVEDADIYEMLADIGVDYAQGYFIGRPLQKLATPQISRTRAGKYRKRVATRR